MLKIVISTILIISFSCGSDDPDPTPQPDLTQSIVDQLSLDSIKSHVQTLANFGTRHYLSTEKNSARDWLVAKMQSYGYQTELESFPANSTTGYNVIAYKQTITTESYTIIDGHYDSRSENIATVPNAPGANDNGSGVAVIIEIARILASVDTKPIKFIFFDAEEVNLVGSYYHSSEVKARGDNIEFVFNLDMVGGNVNMTHQTIVCEEDRNGRNADDALSQALNTQVVTFMNDYSSLTVVEGPAFGTDYVGFEDEGYTIVGLYEQGGQVSFTYHKSVDTFANMHPTYIGEVAKGAIAFFYNKTKI